MIKNAKREVTCVMSIYDEPIWMVKRAIRSMEMQTYKLKKIVVISDKPDNSDLIEFVRNYSKDSRIPIHLEVNPKNYGLAYSLNRGFDIVDTDLVCRMDADDESYPTRIEETIKLIDKGADIATSLVSIVNEKGEYVEKQRQVPCSFEAIKIISRYAACVFHPTWLLKKEVWESIGGYREEMRAAQDYDFVIRALRHGYRIETLRKPLLNYTERSNSMSQKKICMQLFLAMYAQENVYSGKSFNSDIYARIESGTYGDYESFKNAFCEYMLKKKYRFIAEWMYTVKVF